MKIYLVRHGIASERIGGAVTHDGLRPLTEEGRRETKLVARGIKRIGAKPKLLFSSPLLRARETAEIFADVLNAEEGVQICDGLSPAGNLRDVFKFVNKFAPADEMAFFGHEPDIGTLAGILLNPEAGLEIPFKKAGVCRIDVSELPPAWPGILKWFITPKIATLLAHAEED